MAVNLFTFIHNCRHYVCFLSFFNPYEKGFELHSVWYYKGLAKTGIKLTLVVLQVVPTRAEVLSSGDNELERSIKAAMMRMKKVAADSDEEDRGDDETQNTEWDS